MSLSKDIERALLPLLASVILAHGCQSERTPASGGEVCAALLDIEEMPFEVGEPSQDAAYNRIMGAGLAAVPCLVERISDQTPMREPRSVPTYRGLKAGDVALVLLGRILPDLEIESFLPPEYQSRWDREGIYVYYEFVSQPENRLWYQRRVREWVAAHHPPMPR